MDATPSGGLRIPAHIARTGTQTYRTDDGTRVEYRPPDEVFHDDALASFCGATVTVWHPAKKTVDPSNWRRAAVGHLGDDIRQDGDMVAATVYVEDAATIQRINDGELVEISAGYSTAVEMRAGVTDSGERYDAVQTTIRGNHVALLPPGRGRAGPNVRLRIDAHDNEIPVEEVTMTKDELRAELEKLRADMQESKEISEAKEKARDELQGRCDALEAENAKLKADLESAKSPEAIQARVDARVALVSQAKAVKADVDVSGSDRDIMVAVLGETVRADASDEYLRGAFEVVVANAAKTDAARRNTNDAVNSLVVPDPANQPVNKIDEAEEQFLARQRSAWKGAAQ